MQFQPSPAADTTVNAAGSATSTVAPVLAEAPSFFTATTIRSLWSPCANTDCGVTLATRFGLPQAVIVNAGADRPATTPNRGIVVDPS